MSENRRRLETLLVRIQDAFLATPGVSMTAAQAVQRFGVDRETCQAILDVLAEAHVVVKTGRAYGRLYPAAVAA